MRLTRKLFPGVVFGLLLPVLAVAYPAAAADLTSVWQRGSLDAVAHAIGGTGDLNAYDSQGNTPLILAARGNTSAVVRRAYCGNKYVLGLLWFDLKLLAKVLPDINMPRKGSVVQ